MPVQFRFLALLAISAVSVAALPLPAHATAAAVMAMHGIASETYTLPPSPPASVPSFPVMKVSSSVTPGQAGEPSTVKLTYRSMIPGLSLCISYAGAHGAVIPQGRFGSFMHGVESVAEHCVISGRDGLVQDSVFVNIDHSPDALLIANIVLIDNRVSTETVPLGVGLKSR